MQALLDAIAHATPGVDAERLFHGRGGLHPGCKFEALDAGLEIAFAGTRLGMLPVDAVDKVQVAGLGVTLERHGRVKVENARLLGPDDGALEHGGQPAV